MSFEDELRDALRPVDPPAGFADRVMANVERERQRMRFEGERPRGGEQPEKVVSRRGVVWTWVGAGLAASLALGVGLQQVAEQRRLAAEGERAKRDVLVALRIASETLNAVHGTIARVEAASYQ